MRNFGGNSSNPKEKYTDNVGFLLRKQTRKRTENIAI